MKGYRKVRLVFSGRPRKLTQIVNPWEIYGEIKKIERESAEVFLVLHLDVRNCVLHCEEIARGSVNQALVHPREVFRIAICVGASSVILAHNHPSGNPTPSVEDTELTKRLIKAGNIIGINVLDHLIVGANSFCSLREINYDLFKTE